MSIVIKEIHVKTTIEKEPANSTLSVDAINALKQSIIRELREQERKRVKREKQR